MKNNFLENLMNKLQKMTETFILKNLLKSGN